MNAQPKLSFNSALSTARKMLTSTKFGHIINAKKHYGGEEKPLDIINPANGNVIAQIPCGGAREVDQAVAAARTALPQWRAATPAGRAKVMMDIAAAVEAHAEELAAIESLNTGKPMMVSRPEMPTVADVFRTLAGQSRAMQTPAPDEYVQGYLSMVRREPVGVVGAITPWNYPLVTMSFKVAGAIAMGNTVVLKPSEMTPLTSLRSMEIIEAIIPPGVINLVLGTGQDVGEAMSQHPGMDMISLTGSVSSGQRVAAAAAKTLRPTHLELGGKAPVVVFDDADLDALAGTLRFAGFWNSGQECGAATRVLCSKRIRDQLTQKLVQSVSTIKVGSPDEGEDIELGPLVSSRHLESVTSVVERAVKQGAKAIVGGGAISRAGYFFAPTVLTDVAQGAEIARHEIFGPVISIETFDDEAEAVARANDVPYGLSASVWTTDLGRALRMSSALDFGTVWTNAHLVVPLEMPWGGFGASGHGRELSVLSLEDFSRTKHIVFATTSNNRTGLF